MAEPGEVIDGDDEPERSSSELRVGLATGPVYQQALGLLSMSSRMPAVPDDRHAVLVVESKGQVLAACSVDTRSALQASCTEPRVFGTVPDTALVELLSATVDYARQGSIRLLTVLVDRELPRMAANATRAGFQWGGDVSFYLCHSHRFPVSVKSPLNLKTSADRREELIEVMDRTCEGTLDLPGMLSSWTPRNMLDHLEHLSGHRPARRRGRREWRPSTPSPQAACRRE